MQTPLTPDIVASQAVHFDRSPPPPAGLLSRPDPQHDEPPGSGSNWRRVTVELSGSSTVWSSAGATPRVDGRQYLCVGKLLSLSRILSARSALARDIAPAVAGSPYKRAARETGKTCGAFARSTGKPCRCIKLLKGGKCALHGGKSLSAKDKERITRKTGRIFQKTGPKTSDGRARSFAARDAGRDRYIRERRLAALATLTPHD